ncbi:MAG: TatD family hydrolase [Lachnospiraceae bacterium]|nr:TatD family hydrolase [Lachnospiraceae bacterium]
MIFDTHAHYDDEAYSADREEIISSLPASGIGAVVNVGANKASTGSSLALAEKYDFIYAAAGIHPSDVMEYENGTADTSWLEKCALAPKAVAIGEIGLDYHWDEPAREIQKKWFAAQLRVAKKLKKPVIIHSRDAAQDTYDILAAEGGSDIKAVIHCFSYGPDMARRFLDLGYYIGIGGVLTFKNAKKQKEVLAEMPLESLLLETDCPYMAPTPYRGERNSSLYLPLVVREMAVIRGITESEIEEITFKNAMDFYEIG